MTDGDILCERRLLEKSALKQCLLLSAAGAHVIIVCTFLSGQQVVTLDAAVGRSLEWKSDGMIEEVSMVNCGWSTCKKYVVREQGYRRPF